MDGGVDRTDDFARGEFAMLATHRLERDLRILGEDLVARATESGGLDLAVGVVAVQTDPVHLTTAQDLILADDRDVVLGLAGDNASVAADAGVQVDRHAPLVNTAEFLVIVERLTTRDFAGDDRLALGAVFGRELGELLVGVELTQVGRSVGLDAELVNETQIGGAVLSEVGFADDLAAFHRPVLLGVGQVVDLAGDLDGGTGGETKCAGGAGRVEVVADALADATRDRAAVAEREHEGVVGQTWLDVERTADGDAVDGDFAYKGLLFALLEVGVFFAGDLKQRTFRIDAEVQGQARADKDRVIPRNLGDRIRALLEPTVVGEATVVDLGVEAKAHFEVGLGEGAVAGREGEQRGQTGGVEAHIGLLVGGTHEQTVMQELAEHVVGVTAANDARDGIINLSVRIGDGFAGDAGQNFDLGQTVEQRHDHRLHRDDRAVGGAGVSPRLEVVGGLDVRAGNRGGFVHVVTVTHHVGHVFKQLGETEVGRSVVSGIAAEDDQRLD